MPGSAQVQVRVRTASQPKLARTAHPVTGQRAGLGFWRLRAVQANGPFKTASAEHSKGGRVKIGRNQPCHCGSGKKFKKCHGGIEVDEPHLPLAAFLQKFRQSARLEHCLHPDAHSGICNQVIRAHTVQRTTTLGELVDTSNKVMTFYRCDSNADQPPEPKEVGWKLASTFTGFCSLHDNSTFAPVERKAFVFSNQNAFLLCYRALCHELHQKQATLQGLEAQQNFALKCVPGRSQPQLQHDTQIRMAGFKKVLHDLTAAKALADRSLQAGEYSDWDFACLTFEGDLALASAGATTPTRTLDGECLQILHDQSTPIQHLFFCIVRADECSVVVLGWNRVHRAPAAFVTSLLKLAPEQLPDFLVQYCFGHLENTFFSKDWWERRPQEQKDHIGRLSECDAYYAHPGYRHEGYVTWRLLSTVRTPP